MPYNIPTYGGQPVFGLAVRFRAAPNPCALQVDSYQGVNGQVSLFGGTRGGVVHVSGVMEDINIAAVNNDLATLTSFQDGIARTLVDSEGNGYGNAVFSHLEPPGPAVPTDQGWAKPYSCTFLILSG